MPDSELAHWLQSRGFYALLVLALLVLGLLLALGRRRKDRPPPARKASAHRGRNSRSGHAP